MAGVDGEAGEAEERGGVQHAGGGAPVLPPSPPFVSPPTPSPPPPLYPLLAVRSCLLPLNGLRPFEAMEVGEAVTPVRGTYLRGGVDG